MTFVCLGYLHLKLQQSPAKTEKDGCWVCQRQTAILIITGPSIQEPLTRYPWMWSKKNFFRQNHDCPRCALALFQVVQCRCIMHKLCLQNPNTVRWVWIDRYRCHASCIDVEHATKTLPCNKDSLVVISYDLNEAYASAPNPQRSNLPFAASLVETCQQNESRQESSCRSSLESLSCLRRQTDL